MPNHKSAKKRVKTNKRDELKNKAAKSALRTSIKTALTAIAGTDKEAVVAKLRDTQALLGRTWRRGIIHKNKMARLQSRMALTANRAAAAAATTGK